MTKSLIFYISLKNHKYIKMAHKCTLNTLYSSSAKMVVREALSELFAIDFEKILKETDVFAPYLRTTAIYFQEKIKHMYIEEGLILESSEDLVNILQKLSYQEFKKHQSNGKPY